MSDIRAPRVEINGLPAGLDQIWELDLSSGGHFTAMQIRDRKTLGLDFHLARLDAATREMFGGGLDGDRVRACIGHALGPGVADAAVRVNVFRPAAGRDVSVAVSVRPPGAPPAGSSACRRSATSGLSLISSARVVSASPTTGAWPARTASMKRCSPGRTG